MASEFPVVGIETSTDEYKVIIKKVNHQRTRDILVNKKDEDCVLKNHQHHKRQGKGVEMFQIKGDERDTTTNYNTQLFEAESCSGGDEML